VSNNSLNNMDISEKQSVAEQSQIAEQISMAEQLQAVGQQEKSSSSQPLRNSVEAALENYFTHLDGQPVTDLYQMVLAEVEAPLLEAVMRYTGDNQSQASELLGLNRGTLRKKLKHYGFL